MKFLSTLAATLALSACSYLPVDTLRELAQLDPMTADPENIAISFRVPEGLGMPNDSVILTLAAKHFSGEEVDETYVLQRRETGDDVIFQIAPSDLDRLRSQQARVRLWAKDDREGTIAVGFVGGCIIGNGPSPGALLSSSISLNGGTTFLPLMTDIPLSKAMDSDELAQMPPC